jgi:tetratricopeptide (TPR) repeat protein
MTEPKENGDLSGGHSAACGADGGSRLAAEGEIAVARLSMDGGDLPHAAAHLGFAMADDPRLPEAHEALAQLAAKCGGPRAALELFPVGNLYIGGAACRAHLFAAAGQWAEAVGMLAAVIRTQPDRPWAHAAWLTRPELLDRLAPEAAANAVAKVVGGGLPSPLPPELREPLEPFYTFIRAMADRHPDTVVLLVMASGLARRFGDSAAAVGWAERAGRIEPGHMTNLMLGYALREAGRTDEALTVWETELTRDPSDLSLHVDVAELYAATGRPAEGLPWLDRVLAVEPDHPKAAPAVHAIRFAADANSAHLVALTDHLRDHPEHEYAYILLDRLCKGEPWLGSLAPATEATVNVLRQFLAAGNSPRADEIQLAISALEPPSALLSFQLIFPNATAVYHAAGEPDPREPTAEVATRVWQFDGLTARPAVPPPSAQAAETVRNIAQLRWPHPMAAYDHAVHLSGLELDDLLGVLVHPPACRDDEQGRYLAANLPDLWVRAVQVFACLGIAHHKADQPWPESLRRQALHDLLFGPEDWVNEAAAMALVAIAWVDPEAREDIGALVMRRFLDGAKAFQSRVVTIMGSLCQLTLACPWLKEDFTDLARQVLDVVGKIDESEPEDAEDQA